MTRLDSRYLFWTLIKCFVGTLLRNLFEKCQVFWTNEGLWFQRLFEVEYNRERLILFLRRLLWHSLVVPTYTYIFVACCNLFQIRIRSILGSVLRANDKWRKHCQHLKNLRLFRTWHSHWHFHYNKILWKKSKILLIFSLSIALTQMCNPIILIPGQFLAKNWLNLNIVLFHSVYAVSCITVIRWVKFSRIPFGKSADLFGDIWYRNIIPKKYRRIFIDSSPWI